ncbi:MAG TPA: ATP-binding domain-containing protein [Acidimicrobiia bacterium]
MTAVDPELLAEQRYVDRAYGRLEAMRAAARRVADGYAEVGAGGTHQARLERDVAAEVTRRRLAALDIGAAPLCFGRLDLAEDGDGDGDGDAEQLYYIGRVAVTDDDQVPLIVDWRAPVSEPFYRATATDSMGVVRRRHFLTRVGDGRELVGIDDEVFDRDAAESSGFTVFGEGALLAALDRARTGRMSDIVATIQAEQDEAIRSPLPGVLVVAGGPGTGKTAVALHRAAYLLYTHRRRLAGQGVLFVGPNSIFVRYIDQVLPSLGESDVQLSTLAGLKPAYSVGGEDSTAAAHLKGDARMARVIERAMRDREHPLARDMVVMVDGTLLRLSRGASQRIVERARGRRGTHNAKRPGVVRAVVEQLRHRYRRALGAVAPDDADWDRELDGRLRRLPEVRAALQRMWPVLTGGELLHDLFSFPGLVRSASTGILSDDEQALLVRARSPRVRDVAWTEADLALIDEADARLGPPEAARPRRRRARARDDDAASRVVAGLGLGGFLTPGEVARRYTGDGQSGDDAPDEPRTFGHVLVDEAQDVSAMQWRLLARRCPSGSMTIVGDFGQASRAGALHDWPEVLDIVSGRAGAEIVTLTVNYRTPSEIMRVAHRVLSAASPGAPPTRSVRDSGHEPRFVRVSQDGLVDGLADAARRSVGAGGTVAVVARAELHDDLVARLADVGARAGTTEALDAPVAVLTAQAIKGLEFDHVVVSDPSTLVPGDDAGLRLLYVALTRATRTLTVVYAEALPEALSAAALPGAAIAAS